jgi:hypothetical protein
MQYLPLDQGDHIAQRLLRRTRFASRLTGMPYGTDHFTVGADW